MVSRRSFFLVLLASLFVAQPGRAAELKPAHANLRSARAQANREQIFRYLMRGETPSWMQGKSRAQVQAWGNNVRKAVLRNAGKIVARIAAAPSSQVSRGEQMVLGLLSPMQRAELLRDKAGFTVQKVRYKVNGVPTKKYKIRLKRSGAEGESQLKIYNRVMSPNLVTYMPAGGHSKYVSRGQVVDLYGGVHDYGALRANDYSLFPTWLSDAEAKRMKTVFDAAGSNWYGSMGDYEAYGRVGMWPPTPRQRAEVANSCTSGFIRAPVGDRQASYRWIDGLQSAVRKAARRGQLQINGVDLGRTKLLQALTGKDAAARNAIFDQLARQLPAQAEKLGQLRAEVDRFASTIPYSCSYSRNRSGQPPSCTFPYDLMHRNPLATMANVQGDPMGPKGATQKFRAGNATRLGVVTIFDN